MTTSGSRSRFRPWVLRRAWRRVRGRPPSSSPFLKTPNHAVGHGNTVAGPVAPVLKCGAPSPPEPLASKVIGNRRKHEHVRQRPPPTECVLGRARSFRGGRVPGREGSQRGCFPGAESSGCRRRPLRRPDGAARAGPVLRDCGGAKPRGWDGRCGTSDASSPTCQCQVVQARWSASSTPSTRRSMRARPYTSTAGAGWAGPGPWSAAGSCGTGAPGRRP